MAKTRSQKRAAKAKKRAPAHAMYDRFRKEAVNVTREPAEDPRVVVLDARCRHNAKPKADDVAGEMWGDLAGRAIIIGAEGLTDRKPDERRALAADLWDTYKRLDAVDEIYFRRIIGRTRFPNVARMEYLPEAFETRPDEHPRPYMDEDEKDRAAVIHWMCWQGYLGQMSKDAHCAIVSALRQRVMLSHAGRLTGAGEAFFRALRTLDGIANDR